jgi:hypothetical protein
MTGAAELEYLRERTAGLEALVEENLALTRRIAALEAELGRLRKRLDRDGPEPGVSPPIAHRVPPEPASPLAAHPAPPRALESAASPSLLAALEKRRSRPDGAPGIVLVGPPQYFTGMGLSFAHLEIRDILYGLPKEADVSFLALWPPAARVTELQRLNLRDGVEVIDLVLPEPDRLAEILTGLAPAVVMNVGPLAPVIEVFRHLPADLRRAGVLNLLHGELVRFASGHDTDVFERAGTALVTTQIERDGLLGLGFSGDIVTYRRGVNIPTIPLASLDGGKDILCLMEDADPRADSLIDQLVADFSSEAAHLVVMGASSALADEALLDSVEPQKAADLFESIKDAAAVLVPPGTGGLPQALQVALAMGKVCLLPHEPFGRPELADLPGLRYEVEAAALACTIREFMADPQAHAGLAEQAAAYGRTHLRRSQSAKAFSQFIAGRLGLVHDDSAPA